jgi:transposase
MAELELVVERCAGIDVHQAQLRVCVRTPATGRRRNRVEEFATFATTTPDLLELSDWLAERGVTHVAMEGTGVYWKPVYYVLEDAFDVWLVNAQHVKNVPGRKTDTSDAAWLSRLLEHGLLRKSFVPPREIREIRDLTRYRKSLIRERASEVNRLHKVLEDAGVKLATIASDIMGVSGRAMLAALIAGETDADVLAELAKTRLRARLPELRKALNARFREHHGFLVAQILAHVDYLEEAIAQVDDRVTAALEPTEAAMTVLLSIPGIQRRTAEVVIAEIGTDMARFPTSRHLASWAGLCPGNNESAGKRKHGRTTKGSPWLRTALVEAALGATRKHGYLQAKYRRIRSRRGHQRAVIAVAHAQLEIIYTLLSRGELYNDLGADFFERQQAEHIKRRAIRQLERLGHQVVLKEAAEPQPA